MSIHVQPAKGTLSKWLESAAANGGASQAVGNDRQDFSKQISAALTARADAIAATAGTGLAAVFSSPVANAVSTGVGQSISRNGIPNTAAADPGAVKAASAGGSKLEPDATATQEYPFLAIADGDIPPASPGLYGTYPETPPELARQSKAALAEAMRKAGLDPGQFAVGYWEILGYSPGQSRLNHELTIQAPNGRRIDVNADWTLAAPDITVGDIRRMLELGPPSEAEIHV